MSISKTDMGDMFYILVAHGSGSDSAFVGIYKDQVSRNRATMYAIFGESVRPDQEVGFLAILEKLKEDKWYHFEGDPPLQWIDADMVVPIPSHE